MAQRWKNKVRALQQIQTGQALASVKSSLGAVDADLALDVKFLCQIERREDREERKRNVLLPKWLPQAEAYITAGDVYPFLPLVYCMIWSMDVGDFDRALELAEVVVDQGQGMPENFNNSPGAFIADNFRDWVELEYAAGRSVEPYFSWVFELITQRWKLNETLTARWFVLAARLMLRGEDGRQATPRHFNNLDVLETALDYLQKAKDICPSKSGAGTLFNKITSRVNALQRK